MTSTAADFKRDRLTGFNYIFLGYFGVLAALVGPIVAELRKEMGLSYTVAALHSAAWALGNLAAAIIAPRMARWGRTNGLWCAGAGTIISTVLIVIGQSLWLSVPGLFLSGVSLGLIPSFAFATLSDHHGRARSNALTEGNASVSFCMMVSPLVFAAFAATSLGWRSTFIVAAMLLGSIAVAFRGVGRDDISSARRDSNVKPHLHRAIWGTLILLFVGIAIEWGMSVWTIDFFRNTFHSSTAVAAAAISVLYCGLFIGRASGTFLLARFSSHCIIVCSLVAVLVGFVLFWVGVTPALSFAGVLIAGLGVANTYPLSVGLAMSMAFTPAEADHTSGYVWRATSMALLIGPFALASLADGIGIRAAYLLVPMLAIAGIALSGRVHTAVANVVRSDEDEIDVRDAVVTVGAAEGQTRACMKSKQVRCIVNCFYARLDALYQPQIHLWCGLRRRSRTMDQI